MTKAVSLLSVAFVALVKAQSTCVAPPPGGDSSLYSACLGLSSQLATRSLPTDGSSIFLTTTLDQPSTSFSNVNDPFGFPTAVVPVTVSSTGTTSLASSSAARPPAASSGLSSSGSSSQGSLLTAPASATSSSSASSSRPGAGSCGIATASNSNPPSSGSPSSTGSAGGANSSSSPELTNNQVSGSGSDSYRNTVVIPVAVVCTVVPVIIIALILCCFLRRRKRKQQAAAAAVAPIANEKAFAGMSTSSPSGLDSTSAGYRGAGPTGNGHASPYNETSRSGAALAATGAGAGAGAGAAFGRHAFKRDNPVIDQPLDQNTSRFGSNQASGYVSPMNPASAGVSPLQSGYQTAHGSRPQTSQTLGPTMSGQGAGTSTGLAAGGAAVAGAAAGGAYASGSKKGPEHSRSRSRSSTNPRQGGLMSMFNRSTSGSRAGGPDTSGAQSITSEQPPALPELEDDIGSGRLIEGDNPGRDYEKSIRSVSHKDGASSIYDGGSNYGRDSVDVRPPIPPKPTPAAVETLQPVRDTPRPDSDTVQQPLSSINRHKRGASGSNIDMTEIPVGGSALNTRPRAAEKPEAAAAGVDDDDDLFGPYKAPKPYNESTMAAERAAAPSATYTSPAALGQVQSGPYTSSTSSNNIPRPMPAPLTTDETSSSSFPRPPRNFAARPHGASITSTSSAGRATSPTTQTFHYPTREEASQFDFGQGVTSGQAAATAAAAKRRDSQFREDLADETFFDASEAVPVRAAQRQMPR